MLGHVESRPGVDIVELHRFANEPVPLPDGLHWDILGLYREILAGLRAAVAHRPRSVGVDSWAVDYGLLDADGALLGLPYHYRDPRTEAIADPVAGRGHLPAHRTATAAVQHPVPVARRTGRPAGRRRARC